MSIRSLQSALDAYREAFGAAAEAELDTWRGLEELGEMKIARQLVAAIDAGAPLADPSFGLEPLPEGAVA